MVMLFAEIVMFPLLLIPAITFAVAKENVPPPVKPLAPVPRAMFFAVSESETAFTTPPLVV